MQIGPHSLPEEVQQEIQEELSLLLAPQGVEISWKAYYDKFDETHGGSPILFRGKLLWADGWTYAMDHAGPEWPPPEDPKELKIYQTTYWSKRRSVLAQEVRRLKDGLQNLRETQRAKNVPLQRVIKSWGRNEEGMPVVDVKYVDLDFDLLEEKLGHMQEELAEIETKLRELES